MKLRRGLLSFAIAWVPGVASAGGLLLPGAGAVSTSRAGAAVASADDGEALVLNPAGIAKSDGTTVTLSAAMIQYAMEFQRRGSYDAVTGESYPYAGQPFAAVKNDPSPPLGIGSIQPVPVIAVLTDLGGRLGKLRLGIGLYAPNAYPFRDMCVQLSGGCEKYQFNADANIPPPGARYDIMKQEAAFFLPSIAAAYRVLPELDVGLRLSAGQVNLKSTTGLWGIPGNYEEDIKKDGTIAVDATDSFVPGFGLGVTYRPTPNLELAFNYSSELDVHAKGTAVSQLGPSVSLAGAPIAIGPRADPDRVNCAAGGTMEVLKGCVDLALPMTAQLAGRYKFLDAAGRLKADVELDLDWENWGKSCNDADFNDGSCVTPGDYRVVVDADAYINGASVLELKDATVRHGFQDTYGVRVGGSYHLPIGPARGDGSHNEIIVRGGLGYETAAAQTGWLRADVDGAARTTLAVGAAYRLERFEISIGGGAILEGSPSNPNVGGGAEPCNPTATSMTCNGSTAHQGVDPVNPILAADAQALNPVSQGDYKAHYLLLMLGATAWF
ncbi:MAG TPA: outer membrane protein transport protein [Kofleriaceae bacterium]|nr:outer membrane protein transport protein [Kofleriaceae bacterium]